MWWYRLSRGYDSKYWQSDGSACGGSDVSAECDILYKCGAPVSQRKVGWNADLSEQLDSRRYFWFNTKNEAMAVVNCFYEEKRAVDEEISEAFELAFHGLKTLIRD